MVPFGGYSKDVTITAAPSVGIPTIKPSVVGASGYVASFFVKVPGLTPSGQYSIPVVGRGSDGKTASTSIDLIISDGTGGQI